MNNDQRLSQSRRIDDLSTLLVDAGISVIKRNPIPVGVYILGIGICLLFSGYKPSATQKEQFSSKLNSIDYRRMDKLLIELDNAQHEYRRSKGWFTCDQWCQENKRALDTVTAEYNQVKREIDKTISDAKANLGIFSDSGTRELFWHRFSQGKGFATSQSKWDALFMGIGAMSRDETIISYILRLLMSVLFNFTLGMIGAVIGFVFSLPGLISTYQVPLFYALVFFIMAAIAAMSFVATWLLGLYTLAAGSVYVGAKLIASNMRIEGGPNQRAERVNYNFDRRR